MPSINFIDQQTVIPASWLNDVDQLTFDIPDNTSALKGAGLVPFNPALVYADNTIGHAVKYTKGYTNVLEYIPENLWAGILDNTTTTDVSTYVQEAIDALEASGGGTLFVPGKLLCNTPIVLKNGVDLVGAGRNKAKLYKDSTTTKAVTIVAGALVVYNNGATLPSNLNAVLILDGAGGRYTGRVADITIEGSLATPDNIESSKVEFGIVSTGSLSDFTLEHVNIVTVQYAEMFPVIFASRISDTRLTQCLFGLSINNGTSTHITTNYANNCRDWGFYIRDLKYSLIAGNACDSLNSPVYFPTRTRTCSAYKFRSLIGCNIVSNGNEQTYGRSYEFNVVDWCLFENNITIGVGSDYTGIDQIAVFYSTGIMRGTRCLNNFAYSVKASGLLSSGAVPGQHHNIYFEATTFLIKFEFQNNLVTTLANDTLEAGWGNNTFYEWYAGSVVYNPASLADGAGVTTTVTVVGADLGDYVIASFSSDLQGIMLTAWVSAANTVSVRFQNETGGTIDLPSSTLKVRVIEQ